MFLQAKLVEEPGEIQFRLKNFLFVGKFFWRCSQQSRAGLAHSMR